MKAETRFLLYSSEKSESDDIDGEDAIGITVTTIIIKNLQNTRLSIT